MQAKRRLVFISWITALAVVLIGGIGACSTPQATSSAPAAPASTGAGSPQGITMTLGTYRGPVRTPSQMCGFLLVADARVTGVGQAHWNTLTGTKPADASTLTVMQKGYRIYTPMKLVLQHIYIDHRSQSTREFVLDGGQVGADRIIVEDFPQVTSGRYLMVFTPTLMVGQQGFDASRLTLNTALPINAQDIVQLQPKMIEQGQVSQQEVDMPLTQVAQQLASCK